MLNNLNLLLILVCLLNKLKATNSNVTKSIGKNHPNLRNTGDSKGSLVFSALSFTYLPQYKLYMCTGNIKFEHVMDCATYAGSQMQCSFSSQPMTIDQFKIYTTHVFTVKCPSTAVNVLSDDSDVKYFNCLTDTVHTVDMSNRYSKYECEMDETVAIVGIVFGCSVIIVVVGSICCCCMVKKRGKSVVCNGEPPPALIATKKNDQVVYAQAPTMAYVPPSNGNINNDLSYNNNNNNNIMSSGTQPQCTTYLVAQQLPDGTVQYYSNQPAGPNQSILYSNPQQNINANMGSTYPIDSKLTPGGTYTNLPGIVTASTMNNPNSDDEEYPSCKVVLPTSTLSRNPV